MEAKTETEKVTDKKVSEETDKKMSEETEEKVSEETEEKISEETEEKISEETEEKVLEENVSEETTEKVTKQKLRKKKTTKKESKTKEKAAAAGGLDKAAFRAKLAKLREKRKEIMRLNRQEVVEEDRLSKLPKNFHQRQERAEWKLNDIKKRKMCEENGIDYDQHKLLDVSARDAEKIEKAKARKKNFDPGFSSNYNY